MNKNEKKRQKMVMKFVKLYWVVYKYIVQMGILLSLSLFPSPLFFLFLCSTRHVNTGALFLSTAFIIMGPEGENLFNLKTKKIKNESLN